MYVCMYIYTYIYIEAVVLSSQRAHTTALLLYMCPHTTNVLLYMCPHTSYLTTKAGKNDKEKRNKEKGKN